MSAALRPAVFLDRDGVINRSLVVDGKPYAPRRLKDFRLLPRAAVAVRMLKDAGFVVVVVTNQPDIGNGLVDPTVVEAMNARLGQSMPVDEIKVCPHRQNEGCTCRKPRSGMLLEAVTQHGIDLSASYMVGDRNGDILAGQGAGCYTLLVRRAHLEVVTARPDWRVRSLSEAVRVILKHKKGNETACPRC